MGVPYVPVVGLAGTDLLARRDDMRMLPNPFGAEGEESDWESVVVKALRPDVALIHVLEADRAGNVRCGYPSDNLLLAEASRTVIVTAERLVERVREEDAGREFIPGMFVQAVAEAPLGAHPAAMPGLYPVDDAHMRRYAQAARSDEDFAEYLRAVVHNLPDHAAYVASEVPEGWSQSALRAAGD